MQKRYRWLMLNQLDETLSQLKPLLFLQRPPSGWIRAIRETLGMSARQMASRLSVSPPRITRLEADERDGKVTINMLKRTAEALDCVFVYGFVPKTSLENRVKTQAIKVASERVEYVSHSMQLEDQKLSNELLKQEVDNAVEEILKTWPRTLWDMSNEASESKRHDTTD
jgi:predicted DNA-binding mobile mystery protein A